MKKIKSIKIVDPGSPPDVDTDFHTVGRQKVIEEMIRRYGENNVAGIITPGPFKAKNAWNSMCTINSIPMDITRAVSKLLPDSTTDVTIEDILNNESEGKDLKMLLDTPQLKLTMEAASKLNGRQRETGVHACGIIISAKPLDNNIPVQIRQSDNMPVTQWTYYDCEAIGLIKMDFLGLDTVDLIDNTVKSIKKTRDIDLDMEELINGDLADPKVYQLFQEGNTEGIFQFSGAGVQNMLRSVKPTQFDDLAATTAIFRPGPMSLNLHEEYAERKNNPEARIPVHKKFYGTKIEELLEKTYGSLVYQEQIMKISTECAGFSSQEADKLRKAIGKKNATLLASIGPQFKEGLIKNGYDKEAVEFLWDGIVGFGSYAFNLSHSVSYALNSYQSAYLKAHYPVEFMAAALQQRSGDSNKISALSNEAKKMGIIISPPNINDSFSEITPFPSKNMILYGLSNIKKVNAEIIDKIIREREANGKYKSISDFISRNEGIVKAGLLKNLAQSGALDCFDIPRKQIYENVNEIISKSIKINQISSQKSIFDFLGGPSLEESAFNFPKEEWNFDEYVKNEAEIIGMYISAHPLDKIKYDKVDLNSQSINGTFYVTFSSVKVGKDRNKNTVYSVIADNKHSQKEFRLPNKFTERFNKYLALKNSNSEREAAISLGVTNQAEFDTFKQIKPLAPVEEHKVYKMSIITKTFKRGNISTERTFIEDLEEVILSSDGRAPYIISCPNQKLKNKFTQKLKENPGEDIVRLTFPDGSYTDIPNIKFMPGTTQYELEQLK